MDKGRDLGWLFVGVALGAAAVALLTRRHPATNPWNVESVLGACERAAEKLDGVLRSEQPLTA